MERRRVSEGALAPHSHRSCTLATDGGGEIPTPAGAGLLLLSLHLSEMIAKFSINCGARPCSCRTESRALLPALEGLITPRIQHSHKTLLVVTDSRSLLAALNKGPLSQTDWTEDHIRQRLLTLTCAGWFVHLQFCHGHFGAHVNGLADQHATQTMATGQYTEHGIASILHTDLLACFNSQPTNTWHGTICQDIRCYSHCSARPSAPSGKGLIAQEFLDRQELIHLARARCGEAELWGRLYWAVRDSTNQCRFCNILREQSDFVRSNDDPTAPGTHAVPPTTREADASPREGRPSTRRRKESCSRCDAMLLGYTNLIGHCRCFHPAHPPPLPEVKCDFCDMVLSTRSRTAPQSLRTKPRRHPPPPPPPPPCQQAVSAAAGSASLHMHANSPQEALHQLLLECPGTLAVRWRLGTGEDLFAEKLSQWHLLHSRKLLSLLDHVFGTQMPPCSQKCWEEEKKNGLGVGWFIGVGIYIYIYNLWEMSVALKIKKKLWFSVGFYFIYGITRG
ncbi:hypothetical protein MOQ_002806 [Trypanosoma cruzi marinkellei]|uniref:C2H2-type domain-containing protein n=1 Tax=Trypanosoma cruzi marinkellei TaxID=85056 RepID=K2N5Q2_TRYCR|nr:hypothetical protein MOQ_002806 [Trypanosoma cruzi marinkellei]